MAKLEDLTPGASAKGLIPTGLVTVMNIGGALIILASLFGHIKGPPNPSGKFTADAEAKVKVEKLAMDEVMATKQRLGYNNSRLLKLLYYESIWQRTITEEIQ